MRQTDKNAPNAARTRAAAAPRGEIASIGGGRDVTRPWIGALMEPTDRILRLKGGGDLDIYKPILSDDQVKSCLQQRIAAVVSREWEVLPGDESRKARKAADWMREQIAGLKWDRITERMLMGVFFGYAVAEMIYGRDGALVTIEDIKVRDRARFRFDADQRLRLLTPRAMAEGEELPERKFWHYATGADHDDEPYGVGLAHWLYWPVLFKRNDVRFWLVALEKFGVPTAKGTFPPGTSEEDQKKLLDAVRAIQSEAGIIFPAGMDVGLIGDGKANGQSSHETLYRVMDAAISKVILSQTMTTDNGSSLSQAQVHERVAGFVAKSDADLVCSSFNDGPAEWLTRWNFGDDVAAPKVWRIMEDGDDLDAIAERDARLRALGWRRTAKSMVETFGDDYEPAAPEPAAARPSGAASFAERDGGHGHASGSIDELVEQLIAEGHAAAASRGVFAPVEAALNEASSLDDLRRRLDEAEAGSEDGTEDGAEDGAEDGLRTMTDSLARAAFAGRAAGALGAPVQDEETD